MSAYIHLKATFAIYENVLAAWADEELGTNKSIELEDKLDNAVSHVLDAVKRLIETRECEDEAERAP